MRRIIVVCIFLLMLILVGISLFFRDARVDNLEITGKQMILLLSIAAAMLLTGIGLCIVYTIRLRRILHHDFSVFSKLPIRFGVIDHNENVLFLHGNDDSEFFGNKIKKLADIRGTDYERVSAAFAESFTNQSSIVLEYEYGDVKRVMRIAPFPYEVYGRETRVWISHDNTELQNYRELLHGMLQNLPVGIALQEAKGEHRFLICNQAFCRIANYQMDEIIFHTVSELKFEHLRADMFAIDDGGNVENHEGETGIEKIQQPDGSLAFFRVTKFPLELTDGRKLSGTIFTDVTELEKSKQNFETQLSLWDTVINSAPFLFFAKDAKADFRYILCNNNFANLVNQTGDGVIGKNDAELFPLAENVERFRRDDIDAMRNQGVSFTETTVSPDGNLHYFQTVKKPFLGTDGTELLLGVAADVTELKMLSENERIINVCLEKLMTTDDIDKAINDTLGEICEYLHAARTYFFQYGDGVMRFPAEFVRNGSAQYLMDIPVMPLEESAGWYKMMLEHQVLVLPDILEAEQMKKFESWKPIILAKNVRSLYGAGIFMNGKLWGNLGVIYEDKPQNLSELNLKFIRNAAHLFELVLERKENSEALIGALEQARSAARAKSAFLTNMSHEIRTPLNAVIGFSELLAYADVTEKDALDYVNSINLAGKSLLALINDVLDLSKIEADHMQIVPCRVSISRLMSEIESVFGKSAESKGLYLSFEASDDLPEMMLDELRLRQVLVNLVGNAIKFTHHGGVKVITLFNQGKLSIAVNDTGIGIDASVQARIFDPFIQQDSVRDSSVYKGTGLGLAISTKLVERMGGTITLESIPGEGSSFTLYFEEVDVAVAQCEETKVQILQGGFTGIRVLIVDDVAMNLKVLSSMLRKIDIAPVLANSAQDALGKLREQRFDLVLTDMWMPEMNGAELAKIIHTMPELSGIKVVAVTADTEITGGELMDDFDGKLLKPLTMESLKLTLAEIFP